MTTFKDESSRRRALFTSSSIHHGIVHCGVVAAVMTLCLALGPVAEDFEMAKIRADSKSMVTSSMLAWTDVKIGEEIPEHAVRVYEDGPAWCRANVHSKWVPGAVIDGVCYTPFLNQVNQAEKFDVLVSINGSARIELVPWDNLQALPPRGVTTSDMLLVSLPLGDPPVMRAGSLMYAERKATFLVDDKTVNKEEANVLTEKEPEQYILDNIVLDMANDVETFEEETLAETTLHNEGTEEERIEQELDFISKEHVYWGRVKGTISGLQTVVFPPAGRKVDLTWGILNDLAREDQQTVGYDLPAGVAVKAKLIGIARKYEASFTGNLTAIYPDGYQRSRIISSLHIDSRIVELRADFDQPFWIHNMTEVESMSPSSEIVMHSTTTTTSTSTTTTTPSPDEISEAEDKPKSGPLASEPGDDTATTHQMPNSKSPLQSDSARSLFAPLWTCLALLFLVQVFVPEP